VPSVEVDGGQYLGVVAKEAVDELIKTGIRPENAANRLPTYGQQLRIVQQDTLYAPACVRRVNLALSSKFTWRGFYADFGTSPGALDIRARS